MESPKRNNSDECLPFPLEQNKPESESDSQTTIPIQAQNPGSPLSTPPTPPTIHFPPTPPPRRRRKRIHEKELSVSPLLSPSPLLLPPSVYHQSYDLAQRVDQLLRRQVNGLFHLVQPPILAEPVPFYALPEVLRGDPIQFTNLVGDDTKSLLYMDKVLAQEQSFQEYVEKDDDCKTQFSFDHVWEFRFVEDCVKDDQWETIENPSVLNFRARRFPWYVSAYKSIQDLFINSVKSHKYKVLEYLKCLKEQQQFDYLVDFTLRKFWLEQKGLKPTNVQWPLDQMVKVTEDVVFSSDEKYNAYQEVQRHGLKRSTVQFAKTQALHGHDQLILHILHSTSSLIWDRFSETISTSQGLVHQVKKRVLVELKNVAPQNSMTCKTLQSNSFVVEFLIVETRPKTK